MDRNHTDDFEEKDFKQEFYRWFESRGLLFELKSFMRLQMVRSLQENNTINGTNVTTFKKKCSSSPKFQAMNLLVADYLLQQTCLYTISVFASEVPTLNNFPEFSSYVSKVLRNAKDSSVTDLNSIPRFSHADVQDILETLGLPTSIRVGRFAAEQYLEQGEALLTCIVRALTAQNIGTTREQVRADNSIYSLAASDVEDDVYIDTEQHDHNRRRYDSVDHWTDGFRDILLDADFKISHINRIQKEVKRIHEEEIKRVREEEAMKYEKKMKQWEEKLTEQAKEAERKLSSRQSKVEMREENVKSLAVKLRTEHKEITRRLVEFQDQMGKVQEKEKQQELDNIILEKKKSELIIREQQLEEAYNRLSAQQEAIANTKDELEKKQSELIKKPEDNNMFQEHCTALWSQLSETKLKVESLELAANVSASSGVIVTTSGTQTMNTVHREQSSTQTVSDNADKEQQTSEKSYTSVTDELKKEKEVNGQLEQENIELRAHILRLHGRISELNSRAANLSSQLQEARTTIENLRNRDNLALTTPPLIAPQQPIVEPFRAHMNWNQRRLGAGEELFFTPLTTATTQPPPAPAPPPPQRQDARRTPRKFTISQNQLSSSEDSSPTDEALQETRRRLRSLEEESEAVNRRYREFQERQLQATNSIIINPGIHARIFGSSVRERNIFLPVPLQAQGLNTHIQISQPAQQSSRIPVPTFTTGIRIHSQMNQSDVTDDSSSESSRNFLFSSRQSNLHGTSNADNRHLLSNLRKIPPPHGLYKKFFKYKLKNNSKTVNPKSNKQYTKARETPLGSSVNQDQTLIVPNENRNTVEFQQDSDTTKQDTHEEKVCNDKPSLLLEEHKLSSTSSAHERSDFFQKSEDEKLVTVKQPCRPPDGTREEKAEQENSTIKDTHVDKKHATNQPNNEEKCQNRNFMSSSAKSSESLAVESLPLDSDSKFTLNTESGLPVEHTRETNDNKIPRVIHSLDFPPVPSTFTENINTGDELSIKPCHINISDSIYFDKTPEPEFEPLSVPNDIIIHHAPVITDTNNHVQERFSGAVSLQVLNEDVVPLTPPNVSLVSSGISLLKKSDEDNFDDRNVLNTDMRGEIQGAAAVSSQEIQPAYVSSVTSGSDIIRELNTSGNSSSESESSISAGVHMDSQHSSDFWD